MKYLFYSPLRDDFTLKEEIFAEEIFARTNFRGNLFSRILKFSRNSRKFVPTKCFEKHEFAKFAKICSLYGIGDWFFREKKLQVSRRFYRCSVIAPASLNRYMVNETILYGKTLYMDGYHSTVGYDVNSILIWRQLRRESKTIEWSKSLFVRCIHVFCVVFDLLVDACWMKSLEAT